MPSSLLLADDFPDRGDEAVEPLAFSSELSSTSGSERVVARATVVLRCAPCGGHPPVQEQTLESRVEGPLANLQNFFGLDPNLLGDVVAVHRPALQRAQDQQVERALEEVWRLIEDSHRISMGSIHEAAP